MKGPDFKDKVVITGVEKRGDHFTVEGVAEGKKTTVHIPAPSIEGERFESDRQALMRRSLLGSKRMADRDEHRESSP